MFISKQIPILSIDRIELVRPELGNFQKLQRHEIKLEE
jgi:hypothetical protein